MKTWSRLLYRKEYDSPVKYGYKSEHRVKSYVKITAYFNLKEGLYFCVDVPNVSYSYKNPFKALLRALEHESIGMAKYNRIKEDINRCNLYQKLDTK